MTIDSYTILITELIKQGIRLEFTCKENYDKNTLDRYLLERQVLIICLSRMNSLWNDLQHALAILRGGKVSTYMQFGLLKNIVMTMQKENMAPIDRCKHDDIKENCCKIGAFDGKNQSQSEKFELLKKIFEGDPDTDE